MILPNKTRSKIQLLKHLEQLHQTSRKAFFRYSTGSMSVMLERYSVSKKLRGVPSNKRNFSSPCSAYQSHTIQCADREARYQSISTKFTMIPPRWHHTEGVPQSAFKGMPALQPANLCHTLHTYLSLCPVPRNDRKSVRKEAPPDALLP